MTFAPHPCPYVWRGFVAAAALLMLVIAAIGALTRLPFGGPAFLLALFALGWLAVALYLLYRTLSCLTLRYWVDRDGVTIAWLFARYVIPMEQIQRIIRGSREEMRSPWWTWPTPYMTRWRYGAGEWWLSLATRPPPDQLLLITPYGTIGLSPRDPEGFIQALQERYRLGPARRLVPGARLPRITRWPVWRDRLGLALLLAGLLGVLILFGWLSLVYPRLPEELPLHFDAQGMPDRIGPRSGLLILPIIGLLTWAVNGGIGGLVYARQPIGAYLLWGGTLVIQVLAGIALANLIR